LDVQTLPTCCELYVTHTPLAILSRGGPLLAQLAYVRGRYRIRADRVAAHILRRRTVQLRPERGPVNDPRPIPV